eukprot:556912-Rhodomonas_salina.3
MVCKGEGGSQGTEEARFCRWRKARGGRNEKREGGRLTIRKGAGERKEGEERRTEGGGGMGDEEWVLSLIHISEPTRPRLI